MASLDRSGYHHGSRPTPLFGSGSIVLAILVPSLNLHRSSSSSSPSSIHHPFQPPISLLQSLQRSTPISNPPSPPEAVDQLRAPLRTTSHHTEPHPIPHPLFISLRSSRSCSESTHRSIGLIPSDADTEPDSESESKCCAPNRAVIRAHPTTPEYTHVLASARSSCRVSRTAPSRVER